jgi:hypothetical protein
MLRRLSLANRWITQQPEAIAFRSAIETAGGKIDDKTLFFVAKLIQDYKDAGIWDLKQEIGLFVGSNLSAALVKLKTPTAQPSLTNVGFLETDFVQGRGLIGNGTSKHLLTGYIPSVHIPSILDCHMSVYGRNTVVPGGALTTRMYIGSIGATNRFFIRTNSTANRIEGQTGISGEAFTEFGSSPVMWGQFMHSVVGANSAMFYFNGIPRIGDVAHTGTVPSNLELALFACNEEGVIVQFTAWAACGYSVGLGLTADQARDDARIMLSFNQSVRW